MTAWERLEARVRAYAEHHKIGPTELARRLGYKGKSRSWGSEFLAGRRGLTVDRLDLVSEMMGVTIASLFAVENRPVLLSPEALAVARAYDACADVKTRNVVRVALGVPSK